MARRALRAGARRVGIHPAARYLSVLVAGLALAGLLRASPAAAEGPPAQIDELTVTGERPGPGLFHVHRPGSGDLWILGTLSPLPDGLSWRSHEVEQLLGHTDRVLLDRGMVVHAPSAVWILLTQRSLFLAGKNRRLKDLLPSDVYARFAAQRARFGKDGSAWESLRPAVATGMLMGTAMPKLGLSGKVDVNEDVRKMARQRHVHIEEFSVLGADDGLRALKDLKPDEETQCVAAALGLLENGLPRQIERANAWAVGDIARLQRTPQGETLACENAMEPSELHRLYDRTQRAWIANMRRLLDGGGVTLAVIDIDQLFGADGLLDQLRAQGYTVDAPGGG